MNNILLKLIKKIENIKEKTRKIKKELDMIGWCLILSGAIGSYFTIHYILDYFYGK